MAAAAAASNSGNLATAARLQNAVCGTEKRGGAVVAGPAGPAGPAATVVASCCGRQESFDEEGFVVQILLMISITSSALSATAVAAAVHHRDR